MKLISGRWGVHFIQRFLHGKPSLVEVGFKIQTFIIDNCMVSHNYSIITVKPPINGSFPLDLQGKCKELVNKYLVCIKSHSNLNIENINNDDVESCKCIMEEYLKCREQNNLM